MAKRLTPKSTEARDGKIVLTLQSTTGRDFEVEFGAGELMTFISSLRAPQAEALKQVPSDSPWMLRMQGIALNENAEHVILRIFVNDFHFQDFAADRDTPLAIQLLEMGRRLEKAVAIARPEFRPPKKH